MSILATLVLFSMFFSFLPPRTDVVDEPMPAPMLSDQWIVGLHSEHGANAPGTLIPHRSTVQIFAPFTRTLRPLGGGAFLIDLSAHTNPGAEAINLAIDRRIRYIEPDYLLSHLGTGDLVLLLVEPNDPAWLDQNEIRHIEVDRIWDLTTGKPEIIIAMLDTGVRSTHVDLAGKVLPGFDFLAGTPGAQDDQGHGTFTAALAGGRGNNGAGMAGACWGCRILPLKILNQDGRGPVSAFSQAIRYAVDHGARVINVSAGGPNRSQAMEDAIEYALSKNVLIVAAAGNSADTRPNYPAALEPVIAVSASSLNDTRAEFSTFGTFIDIAAPGVNITSAAHSADDRVVRASGTSASAALVSGSAGLLLSLRPELSYQEVTQILLDTAVAVGMPEQELSFGSGRLSSYDAALATLRPQPTGEARLQASSDTPYMLRLSGTGFRPGEHLRAWRSSQDGRISVMRGLVADSSGGIDVTVPQEGELTTGIEQVTLVGDESTRVATAAVKIILPTAENLFPPQPAPPPGSDLLYFQETGHTLGSHFRRFWEANGGVPIFGFPISQEFREVSTTDGKTYVVQYFERNRFEYHPEHQDTPDEVQLGLLGSLTTRGRIFPRAASVPADGLFFPETRYSLSGDFLGYWETNGGLPIFGYPISEPLIEHGRLVQYFERNRFELHPELPPAYRVSLGLLGRDLAHRNGYLPRP